LLILIWVRIVRSGAVPSSRGGIAYAPAKAGAPCRASRKPLAAALITPHGIGIRENWVAGLTCRWRDVGTPVPLGACRHFETCAAHAYTAIAASKTLSTVACPKWPFNASMPANPRSTAISPKDRARPAGCCFVIQAVGRTPKRVHSDRSPRNLADPADGGRRPADGFERAARQRPCP
jgi:hypothetical protein